ncbi:hypothetical protein LXA43DRAFT_1091026 [Ganoderma leucocontextum]|nr:hypothetical protein LXA43DRAFT_1091026 [Ganoderma leucocontextum]
MPPKGPKKQELEVMVETQRQQINDLTTKHAQIASQLQVCQEALAEGPARLAEGQVQLTEAQAQLTEAQAQLAEAQDQLVAAEEAATASEAARAALQVQLDDATAAADNAGQALLNDQVNMAQVPRPAGSTWSIRESMKVTQAEYAEIQRTIRSLVIRAALDWTDDFRHLDPEKLAQLFRAARAAHPILQRYANNWATAAIARQYMQNKRKHAYKQGYISKRRAHQVGDQENVPAGHRNRRDQRGDA